MYDMRLQGRRTFLAFLDVSKAYDIVWREGLWMKMDRVQGFRKNLSMYAKERT